MDVIIKENKSLGIVARDNFPFVNQLLSFG